MVFPFSILKQKYKRQALPPIQNPKKKETEPSSLTFLRRQFPSSSVLRRQFSPSSPLVISVLRRQSSILANQQSPPAESRTNRALSREPTEPSSPVQPSREPDENGEFVLSPIVLGFVNGFIII